MVFNRQRFFIAGQFIDYWLHALDQHSLQSPYVFNFFNQVIAADQYLPKFQVIEDFRARLQQANHVIQVEQNLGAASLVSSSAERKVSSIARHSLSSAKFSRMLFRMIRFMGSDNIIELGTSLGINSLYLSAANSKGKITTFEGCSATAQMAHSLFEQWEEKNIKLIEGNIDQTLLKYLSQSGTIDLVYIDANHRFAPTLQYFEWLFPLLHPERGILVFDDIHWSQEMALAWNTIRHSEKVGLTIDIFDAGLVFKRPMLTKQHFVLNF